MAVLPSILEAFRARSTAECRLERSVVRCRSRSGQDVCGGLIGSRMLITRPLPLPRSDALRPCSPSLAASALMTTHSLLLDWGIISLFTCIVEYLPELDIKYMNLYAQKRITFGKPPRGTTSWEE